MSNNNCNLNAHYIRFKSVFICALTIIIFEYIKVLYMCSTRRQTDYLRMLFKNTDNSPCAFIYIEAYEK